MADLRLVLIALVSAAAEAEGHTCLGFEVGPGKVVACPHGFAVKVGVPVLEAEAAA